MSENWETAIQKLADAVLPLVRSESFQHPLPDSRMTLLEKKLCLANSLYFKLIEHSGAGVTSYDGSFKKAILSAQAFFTTPKASEPTHHAVYKLISALAIPKPETCIQMAELLPNILSDEYSPPVDPFVLQFQIFSLLQFYTFGHHLFRNDVIERLDFAFMLIIDRAHTTMNLMIDLPRQKRAKDKREEKFAEIENEILDLFRSIKKTTRPYSVAEAIIRKWKEKWPREKWPLRNPPSKNTIVKVLKKANLIN